MATSFRTDGFPDGMSAFLLRAHITLRNAGEFIKLSHNYTLQMLVSLFRKLDVRSAGVSAKVWQTTSVWISRIFIFTIGF